MCPMDNQLIVDNVDTLRYFTADFGRVPNTFQQSQAQTVKSGFLISPSESRSFSLDSNDLSLQFDNQQRDTTYSSLRAL